jgi:hypothetical protein
MNTDPENQFDFWLGEWDATWGEDGKSTNHVTRILDGKVVQEDFNAPDLHGMSFSVYDAQRKLWCQTWIDNNGSYLDFTGNFEDGKRSSPAMRSCGERTANREWSGTTLKRGALIGIGSAPTMAGTHGARSGKFSIKEKYKEQIGYP